MKIKEIIQRIQSLYSKGVQSDNTLLSDRHIYNKLLSVRAKLISQQSNKKQKINQWNYQTLNCVELILAMPYECPCLPPIGCEILRTKHPLPRPLSNLNKHLIQSVTSVNGDVIFSEITWDEKKYKKSSKYTSNKPDYFIKNNYLYITHKSGLKVITITALFDDPLEALRYPSLCNDASSNCVSELDKEFFIDNDLIDSLIDLSKQELLEQFSQMKNDNTNNAVDDLPEMSK